MLTNADISNKYRDYDFYLMMSSIQGSFAYWVVSQYTNNDIKLDINIPLNAFSNYLSVKYFPDRKNTVLKMSYSDVQMMINEKVFMSIPEIMKLNQIDGWIDLYALAKNVFFMVLRDSIIKNI